MPPDQVLVCTSCHGLASAAALARRLSLALGSGFRVAGVECMSGCKRPGVIAFRGEGKASYLFGDIEPEGPIDDLLAFARLYRALPDGWITDARGLGRLRHQALARIPVAPEIP